METNTCGDSLEKMHPTIAGNTYFLLVPGMKCKTKDDIRKKIIEEMQVFQEVPVGTCDFIVVLCFLVSRAGTDIDGALKELNDNSDSKPAFFMVFHHTFNPEMTVQDSSRFIKRRNTLTVDCLFHEDIGFLNCARNDDALNKIRKCLPPQKEPSIISYFFTTLAQLFRPQPKMLKTPSSSKPELNIVLLGMSRSEMTAVGDMILGKEDIQADPSPASPKILENHKVDTWRWLVKVIYSPNVFNCGLEQKDIVENIHFWTSLSSDGPYAFLLIIPAAEAEKVKEMEMIFEKCREKLMIVFTVTDEQQKQKIQMQFQTLRENCGERFHILNMSQTEKRVEVLKLLEGAQKMVTEDFELIDECMCSPDNDVESGKE